LSRFEKARVDKVRGLYEKNKSLTDEFAKLSGKSRGSMALLVAKWDNALTSGTQKDKDAAMRDMSSSFLKGVTSKQLAEIAKLTVENKQPWAKELRKNALYGLGKNEDGTPLQRSRFQSESAFAKHWKQDMISRQQFNALSQAAQQ